MGSGREIARSGDTSSRTLRFSARRRKANCCCGQARPKTRPAGCDAAEIAPANRFAIYPVDTGATAPRRQIRHGATTGAGTAACGAEHWPVGTGECAASAAIRLTERSVRGIRTATAPAVAARPSSRRTLVVDGANHDITLADRAGELRARVNSAICEANRFRATAMTPGLAGL